ncbi:hypothetical protein JCM5350_007687 [Sporobolomyces pararoseus]
MIHSNSITSPQLAHSSLSNQLAIQSNHVLSNQNQLRMATTESDWEESSGKLERNGSEEIVNTNKKSTRAGSSGSSLESDGMDEFGKTTVKLLPLSSTSISAVQLLRSQIFKESIADCQTLGGVSE